MSACGGVTEDPSVDGPETQKSKSGPEFLGLSRCAGCYNQEVGSMPWRGHDGESSSSAEDSGPEVECESESESSSMSSSSVCGDATEPESGSESGGAGADRREETVEMSEREQDGNKTQGRIQSAPLVKSFSSPPSLLPRPSRIVSTLHLEVLPEKHSDRTFTIRRHLSGKARGGGSVSNSPPPRPYLYQQMGLPWQQRPQPTLQQLQYHQHQQQQRQQKQMAYQYQQQPQYFPPFAAQGQRLPPPCHSLPMLHLRTVHSPLQAPNVPQTHLYGVSPRPCCYRLHLPHTYWSHNSGGQS